MQSVTQVAIDMRLKLISFSVVHAVRVKFMGFMCVRFVMYFLNLNIKVSRYRYTWFWWTTDNTCIVLRLVIFTLLFWADRVFSTDDILISWLSFSRVIGLHNHVRLLVNVSATSIYRILDEECTYRKNYWTCKEKIWEVDFQCIFLLVHSRTPVRWLPVQR
jgi:hypothetical protein